MIDFSPVLSALIALACAAVTASAPAIAAYVVARLKIANQADAAAIQAGMAERIEKAADAAAGLAYHYAASHEGGLASVSVRDAGMAAGVNHVIASVPDALKALGITPEHVGQMVAARLGVLLAHDPTVSAGAPEPTVQPAAPVAAPSQAPAQPEAPQPPRPAQAVPAAA